MQHSSSCKGCGFSRSQKILRILWIPNVHHRIHNSPPTVSILSQINVVYVLHYISVRPILILYSHLSLGPPSVLFLPGFPTKNPYVFPFSPYVPHSPPISSSSDYHSTILCGLQIMKLLTMQFSPFSCCLLPPTPPMFSSAPSPRTPSAYVLPSVRQTKFYPLQNHRHNYSSV